jgi:hypothetical protein
MLSRALSLAAVMLLIGGFAAAPARGQNLEAGKSPSQIFAGTCTACHKGARGLLKTVAPGSLPGFLRQHYTTSSEMAGVLASYLISNGASDTRYQAGQPKGAKDARQEPSGQPSQLDRYGRPTRRTPTQEASRPDADGRVPARVLEGQSPAAGAEERGPDGRKLSAKQRLSKRGRAGEELPKPDAVKPAEPMGEAAKGEAPKEENANISKDEVKKPEVNPEEQKTDSAKLDAPKDETPKSDVPLRADPVPSVTPAPKSSEGEGKPAEATSAANGSPASSTAATSASNAAAEPPGSTPAAAAAPAAVAPPPPPAPAGPPAPPISQ